MNELENRIYLLVECVVDCCVVDVEGGKITREEILSKSKKENVMIARYMLAYHLLDFGLSYTTISQFFGCTIQSARNMIANHYKWLRGSAAYQIANKQVESKKLERKIKEI